MVWLKIVGLSVVLIALAGCASDHDLRDGKNAFGGGYQVTPVADSIYYIYARTNAAVAPQQSSAEKMFVQRATEACKSESVNFVKARVRLNDSEFAPLIVTEAFGFVVCPNAGLDEIAVETAITAYEAGQ